MAQKSTKIADIKSPGKVTPEASSRPIVVTNRPVLASDPMVVSSEKQSSETDGEVKVVNRSAKVINPIDTLDKSETEEPAALEPEAAADPPPADTAESPEPARSTELEKPEARDAEAEASAAETEAETARIVRMQELEQLIASGQYAVPIDAVQRKRSRMFVFLMCFLALVLLVVLLDALADVGIMSVPSGIPHTHIFSGA